MTLPRGPATPRGPIGIIQQQMRERHVETLKLRMPVVIIKSRDEDNKPITTYHDQEIHIFSDPRSNESLLAPAQLNDSEAIHNLLMHQYGEYDDPTNNPKPDSPRKFSGPCQTSRRSVPYVEGGPAPADDYNDIWDVIIPGGVPDTVVVSQVAFILPDLPTLFLPDGLRRVYTITHIAQDRLKYVARLTTEVYGLRREP